jgi:hypothetical protein
MQDVAASMVDDFAACLSARFAPAAAAASADAPAGAPSAPEAPLSPPPPSQAASEVKALPLLWKALRARLARLFRRGS